MKVFVINVSIIIITIIGLISVVLFLRDYYVKQKLRKLQMTKFMLMKGLNEKLESKVSISEAELLSIAANPSLRLPLFRALDLHNRKNLFPEKYYTEEKGAEGYMVNWLEFPTELGNAPDEISLLRVVTLNVEMAIHYYVFKFRANTPRWAAHYNWMIGVCGPYNIRSMPFDIPIRIFSRFQTLTSVKAEVEVKWVHENINA